MLLHVLPGAVGHVLVEAPQQDGAHHDRDVQPQPRQEARALQRHVGRPDQQGLPRAVGQGEQVVAGGRTTQNQRLTGGLLRAPSHQAISTGPEASGTYRLCIRACRPISICTVA